MSEITNPKEVHLSKDTQRFLAALFLTLSLVELGDSSDVAARKVELAVESANLLVNKLGV